MRLNLRFEMKKTKTIANVLYGRKTPALDSVDAAAGFLTVFYKMLLLQAEQYLATYLLSIRFSLLVTRLLDLMWLYRGQACASSIGHRPLGFEFSGHAFQ